MKPGERTLASLVAAALLVAVSAQSGGCTADPRPRPDDIDCYPPEPNFPNATEEACLAQGCCWKSLAADPLPSCVYPHLEAASDAACAMVPLGSRLECRNPRYFMPLNDMGSCERVGCCFDEAEKTCFQPFFEGYELVQLQETSNGWQGTLVLHRDKRGPFGNDLSRLELHVIQESADHVRVRITDPSFPRYEVPDLPVYRASMDQEDQQPAYRVHFTERPFGIAVTRRDSGEVLFNSTPPLQTPKPFNGLVFSNQFLEISTQLQADQEIERESVLYGLGERVAPLRLGTDELGDHYPMFSRSQSVDTPHTPEGGDNLFGVHPFYLQVAPSGRAHGVFMLSSNAMEVVTQKNALTFRITGGILDFFVFVGPSPDDVVSQYTAVVGRPALPPYWALGYHLGRWGEDDDAIEDAVELVGRMRTSGVPLEAFWQDIEYMQDQVPLTLDPDRFPPAQMEAFVNDLHFHNQYYVAIQTPAVGSSRSSDDEYQENARIYVEQDVGTIDGTLPFELGSEMGIFIKDVRGDEAAEKFVGSSWSSYVDFSHPNATQYWYQVLSAFHKSLLPFDGLWIDMNEPTSTCDEAFAATNHSCHAFEEEEADALARAVAHGGFVRSADVAFPFDPYRQPFVPGQNTMERGGHGNLNSATLPMAARQHASLHYNLHSLYGHAQAKTTRHVLDLLLQKRSLLLSRSTFAGDGRYAGHWLGPNAATWENLRLSIAGVLQMNMFGIPLVGPCVCGYHQDADKELCVRWHQAASFFPLMRNHAHKSSQPQAPVDFDLDATNGMRATLLRRYRYLPYMYTLMFKAHATGSTVVRPLAFEFPDDADARALEFQYLLGPALMVSPVVHEHAIATEVYFPNATWYEADTGRLLMAKMHDEDEKELCPRSITLLTPLHELQLHIRGGHIVPTQAPAATTAMSRRGAYTLLVALDPATPTMQTHGPHDQDEALGEHEPAHAMGELFVDDGDSLHSVMDQRYSLLHFHAFQPAPDSFEFVTNMSVHGYEGPEMKVPVAEIHIYGLRGSAFRANSSLVANVSTVGEAPRAIQAEYFAQANMAILRNLDFAIGQNVRLQVTALPGAVVRSEDGRSAEQEATDGAMEGKEPKRKHKKSFYTVVGIAGSIVGAAFVVGLIVVYFLLRRRNAGYEAIT